MRHLLLSASALLLFCVPFSASATDYVIGEDSSGCEDLGKNISPWTKTSWDTDSKTCTFSSFHWQDYFEGDTIIIEDGWTLRLNPASSYFNVTFRGSIFNYGSFIIAGGDFTWRHQGTFENYGRFFLHAPHPNNNYWCRVVGGDYCQPEFQLTGTFTNSGTIEILSEGMSTNNSWDRARFLLAGQLENFGTIDLLNHYSTSGKLFQGLF